MKRVALVSLVIAAALLLIGSVAAWMALSSWMPEHGKALLIREVERQAPVRVSIGAMRYDFLQGIVLDAVRVTSRDSREPWCEIPFLQARLSWPALLFTRTVVLHGRARLTQPAPTDLTVACRYALRDHGLSVDLQTTDFPVRSIVAPLTRIVPPALSDGAVRLRLHLRQSPPTPLVILGEVTGTRVVWTAPSWRASGDVTVEGSASPPSSKGGRWSLEGRVMLRQANLQGLPIAGSITSMEGTARLKDDVIQIDALTGIALSSSWKLEGTATLGAPGPTTARAGAGQPSVEVLLSSHASLAPLANALPGVMPIWRPEGAADLRAVCRGPMLPSLQLDCLVAAAGHDVKIAGTKLTQPLTDVAGSVGYDLWARHLVIERLTGRFANQPFTVSGEFRAMQPMELALSVTGTLPLDALTPWLPSGGPVNRLGGEADVNLMINGPSTGPYYSGKVEFRKASMRWAASGLAISELTGEAHVLNNHVEISDTTLKLNDHPLALTATITPLVVDGREAADVPNHARVIATATLPEGQLQLTSRITPEDIVLEEGRLALAQSRLRIIGRVSRGADRAGTVTLNGTLELAELSHLPFLPLPWLDAWKLEGMADVRLKADGRLTDWRKATLDGRLQAARLRVRELPLEQVTGTIEQSHGLLRVYIPSALVADGKFWAELAVKHQPQERGSQDDDYILQADLVDAHLASLTQAIAAWRSRTVTGSASAHALLSGTWERRPTWRGEGWLNATGERLGDVPLLDTLFHGLFGVLGERLGLESLRRAQITQASLRWQLSRERFRTDDLRLGGAAGTEPVAIYGKGSVGFDRTLDFVIEPELSQGVVLESPTTATLARTVLKAAGQLERLRQLIGRHRITGTVDKPEYRFEITTQELFKQFTPDPTDLLRNLLDAVR